MALESAYWWITLLLTVGYVQSAVDQLRLAGQIPVSLGYSLADAGLVHRRLRWLRFGFDSPGIKIIIVLKILLGCTIFWFLYIDQVAFYFPLAMLVLSQLGQVRFSLLGNSDAPMQHVILVALVLHHVCDDIRISRLSLFFISAMLCLAYLAAGWHKIVAAYWRKGDIMSQFFEEFARYMFLSQLAGRQGLMVFMSRAVIVFELGFMLSVFHSKLALVAIVAGVFFHAAIAVSTGINHFLWTFISAYPAFCFTAIVVQDLLF